MKTRKLPRIQLDEKHLPYKWQEKLIANQEIGGLFLVFLSGKNGKEIDNKVKQIKHFCKTLNGSCKDFAKVKPL